MIHWVILHANVNDEFSISNIFLIIEFFSSSAFNPYYAGDAARQLFGTQSKGNALWKQGFHYTKSSSNLPNQQFWAHWSSLTAQ